MEEDTASIAPLYDLVIQNPGRTAAELLLYVNCAETPNHVSSQKQPETKQIG